MTLAFPLGEGLSAGFDDRFCRSFLRGEAFFPGLSEFVRLFTIMCAFFAGRVDGQIRRVGELQSPTRPPFLNPLPYMPTSVRNPTPAPRPAQGMPVSRSNASDRQDERAVDRFLTVPLFRPKCNAPFAPGSTILSLTAYGSVEKGMGRGVGLRPRRFAARPQAGMRTSAFRVREPSRSDVGSPRKFSDAG